MASKEEGKFSKFNYLFFVSFRTPGTSATPGGGVIRIQYNTGFKILQLDSRQSLFLNSIKGRWENDSAFFLFCLSLFWQKNRVGKKVSLQIWF